MSAHKQHPVRRIVAALCTFVLIAGLASPVAASEEFESQLPEENATSHPAVDAAILRPLGLAALFSGVALFIPVGALTLIARPSEIDKPFGYLVVAPARYVWVDPLGKH